METGQILIYHGKHGDEYWLADTPKRLNAAKRELFDRLDEWHCYEEESGSIALELARAGDSYFIDQFLESHRGCEYEDWDLEEAVDATV